MTILEAEPKKIGRLIIDEMKGKLTGEAKEV